MHYFQLQMRERIQQSLSQQILDRLELSTDHNNPRPSSTFRRSQQILDHLELAMYVQQCAGLSFFTSYSYLKEAYY